jgi:chorismate--pyruvate lyase
VYHGHSAALEGLLQCPGPFWGRNYLFHHDGEPLTLIHEVFSNRIEARLGPQWAAGGSGASVGF